mgnify:CR=1 FL=1
MRRRNWKIAATLTGVILTVILLRSCVATSYLIPSTGMENSLYRGERILVNKWSYGLRLPFINLWGYHRWGDKPVRKDDILVFNNPANSHKQQSTREKYTSAVAWEYREILCVDSLFSVIPSEKKKTLPTRSSLYISPEKREAVRLTAHYPFYPPQRIIRTGYGKKRTQLQQVRVLSVGTGFRNKQLDRACR